MSVNLGVSIVVAVFPAGILQPPFFSEEFPNSMNYRAIGTIIGHEITHGFDDHGSQYDSEGKLRNWWQPSDRKNYLDRIKCIVDQFSKIRVEEVNMTLNGINVQGEAVSDVGGLKAIFRAYKQFISESGQQKRLYGLKPDQLFFLSYAQIFCEKWTREGLIISVTTAAHPPGRYRMNGAFQNSEDFSKAYNCARGSFMNPEKKCALW